MKQLLEDMLLVLNAIPNRKPRGKEWTTYDLAKRVEEKLKVIDLLVTIDDFLTEVKQTEK